VSEIVLTCGDRSVRRDADCCVLLTSKGSREGRAAEATYNSLSVTPTIHGRDLLCMLVAHLEVIAKQLATTPYGPFLNELLTDLQKTMPDSQSVLVQGD